MATNREEYLKRHNLKGSKSLADLSKTSKVPLKIIREVYNRGVGAYKTNPSSVRNTKGVKGGPGKKLSKEHLKCLGSKIKKKSSSIGLDTNNIKEKKYLTDWFKKKN